MLISGGERVRYDCQLVLGEIGERGQDKLRHASVLVVGAGGLGAPALLYLAAAGVGRIGVVDDDVVELSNLQRQVLFTTRRHRTVQGAGRRRDGSRALNPEVACRRARRAPRRRPNAERAPRAGYDVIVTAVDNFAARFLLNDACVLLKKTLVDGAVLRLIGLAMTVKGGETACYRCLFPEPPPAAVVVSCSEAGVLGPIPGVIGTIQALEVDQGHHRRRAPALRPAAAVRRRRHDASARSRSARVPGCPVCGQRPRPSPRCGTRCSVTRAAGDAAGPRARGGRSQRRTSCWPRSKVSSAGLGSACVAFSGGVDSSLALWAAVRWLGARQRRRVHGRRPRPISTQELDAGARPRRRASASSSSWSRRASSTTRASRANPRERCYTCKWHLLEAMSAVAGAARLRRAPRRRQSRRPRRPPARHAGGRRAGVRHPLLDAGLGKADVRRLARAAGLATWDAPQQACLASRIPYGEPITVDKLRAGRGRRGGAARARLPRVPRAAPRRPSRGSRSRPASWSAPPARPARRIAGRLRALGFTYVALDLHGFRSGSMNEAPDGRTGSRRPTDGAVIRVPLCAAGGRLAAPTCTKSEVIAVFRKLLGVLSLGVAGCWFLGREARGCRPSTRRSSRSAAT